MRSDSEQPVALHDRFLDQAEFAVFEVADAAVDHVGGGAAGSLAVVAAFHEGNVNALQREVTESSYAVDAAAYHQHLCMRTAPQMVDGTALSSLLLRRCCGRSAG